MEIISTVFSHNVHSQSKALQNPFMSEYLLFGTNTSELKSSLLTGLSFSLTVPTKVGNLGIYPGAKSDK